jgi:3-hydroxyisobutyrate dehydrogenase
MEPATPGKTKLGWIGTGVMGSPMVGHLLAAGFEVAVFTRTPAKAQPLIERGAKWCDSPARLAKGADVVFTMVGYPSDVRSLAQGPDGIVANLPVGGVLVDMTTSEPSLAVELAALAEQRSCFAIDAPVSGGELGAKNKTLSVMVGGNQQAIAALEPCFATFGQTIIRQGGPGAGQHAKLANQILIASNMVGVCEALVYGYRAGLNLETLLQSVVPGAAGSWSLSNLAPRMIRNDFAPGFFVEHFVKDLGIALNESRRMQLSLPGLALAEQLYLALAAQGGARLGTQALVETIAKLAAIDWTNRIKTTNRPV